jgi:RNA-directed DNA polymerase
MSVEPRGPTESEQKVRRGETRLDENPTTEYWADGSLPEKVALLRQKLGQKAKEEPKFRFYALYDRIHRKDVLYAGWKQVKSNRGSAGIDGVTIQEMEHRIEAEVESLCEELRLKKYKPQAVKRVWIPKANGKLRPLGIPTVRDRIVQTAAMLVLEPIFEADFKDCSYGFRPERSAHGALEEIRKHLKSGYQAVYDADLKGYFDSIPHEKLMACLRMRITDGSVLKLIRMWLQTPVVEEPSGRGGGGGDRTGRKPQWSRSKKGTPQGGVISPLLANIYLHWFDEAFHRREGPAQWANAKLVRYADDFVVLARYQSSKLIYFIESKLEGWLGLEINREKTRVVKLNEEGESLDFLGFTFRYDRDLKGRKIRYLNVTPSKKSILKEKETIRKMTGKEMCFKPIPVLIGEINRNLTGWSNYFNFGYPRKAFRAMNWYVRERMTIHLQRRSQRPYKTGGRTFYAELARLQLKYL